MPPKAKFKKQEIINVALALVREEGGDSLTARSLAARLGSSPRPIFTVFDSMEQVTEEVIFAARSIYDGYISAGLAEDNPFRGVGRQYISFAIREPNLFRLLFMSEKKYVPSISSVLALIDDNYDKILASVKDAYGIGGDAAARLYKHLWIYSHGIAVLCSTGMCAFTSEEIDKNMAEVCLGLIKNIISAENTGENND